MNGYVLCLHCLDFVCILKAKVSESVIQKSQAVHEGWFIKFSKLIPCVTDLLEIVRSVVWSKDLACPVQSWQWHAIASHIGQFGLLTGIVDLVQIKEIFSFNISVK